MSGRREVRVTEAFFEELDAQLGSERGARGEPSATDFLVVDLSRIVDEFATGFDDFPEAVLGVGAVRMLIGTRALVRAYVVHGIETTAGVVELIGVELDR